MNIAPRCRSVKYLFAFISCSFILLGVGAASGLWIPRQSQDLWDESQTIFVGNITGTNTINLEGSLAEATDENGNQIMRSYTLALDVYHVKIEQFLKNPQTFDKINVTQPTISGAPGYLNTMGGFQMGDRVLFYLDKIDGTNIYSPESFKIPEFCNGNNVLMQKRLEFGSNFTVTQNGIKVDYGNFTANKPIQFLYDEDMDTLSGKSFDVVVSITKNTGKSAKTVFSQEIHTGSKPCEWIASAEWKFTPEQGDYNMSIATKDDEGASDQSHIKFSVKSDTVTDNQMSPLQQFKSGIPIDQIQCKEGFARVIKLSNNIPICVKSGTVPELVKRGVISNTFDTTNNPGLVIPRGDLLTQNDTHREITILSVSPQNITLPEPKKQTPKTTCANGACFTPE